jgi:hypothetical protein
MGVSILLSTLLGLHWMLLQLVAWGGMLAAFSSEVPLWQAVSKTLDGRHSCQICRWVQEGHAEQRSKESASVGSELQLPVALPPEACCWLPPTLIPPVWATVRSLPARSEGPPRPRPRDGISPVVARA